MVKRQCEVMLRLTQAELDALTEKTRKAHMSREEFCRRVLDGESIKEFPPPPFHHMWAEIRRVGNLLYQLEKLTRGSSIAAEIKTVADEAQRSGRLFVAAYTNHENKKRKRRNVNE